MFFFIRMIAVAILGPWAMSELEKRPAFGVLLSSISVVLTVWMVVDAIALLNSVSSWAGGK